MMSDPSAKCIVRLQAQQDLVLFYDSYLHMYPLTHAHKQHGAGWVCLFKHSRSLLISNLSEFCPTSCVSTRVRDYTTGCQCLSQRLVVSHSLIIRLFDPPYSRVHSLLVYDVQVNNSHSTVWKQPLSDLKLQRATHNIWIVLSSYISAHAFLADSCQQIQHCCQQPKVQSQPTGRWHEHSHRWHQLPQNQGRVLEPLSGFYIIYISMEIIYRWENVCKCALCLCVFLCR